MYLYITSEMQMQSIVYGCNMKKTNRYQMLRQHLETRGPNRSSSDTHGRQYFSKRKFGENISGDWFVRPEKKT